MLLKYKSKKLKEIEYKEKERAEMEKAKVRIYEKVQKINEADNNNAFSNCIDILRKYTKK